MKKLIRAIIEKVTYFFATTKYNNFYSYIDKYDFISFDIFDTLIKRNVQNPTDIFEIIQKRSSEKIYDFKEKRMIAEKTARKKSNREEVSLKEIYNELDYPANLKKELYNLEIDIEIEYCTKNKEMYKIYKYCLENNKKIILTSDMYLPKDVIEKILNKNDYKNYKKLYLSSYFSLTKHTSNLFKYVLNDQKIKNKEIIHIGDSIIGDYWAPKSIGIRALLINRHSKNSTFNSIKNNNLEYNVLSSFLNNTTDIYTNVYSKFGYEVFGPILYSFTLWIHEKIVTDKIDKIFFLARDAKIVMEAYEKLFNNSNNLYYLKISRKSVISANLDNIKNFGNLFDNYKSIIKDTSRVIDLFHLLNIDKNNFLSPSIYNKLLSDLTTNEKDIIYSLIESDIQKNSKEQKNLLKKYLHQNNFNGNVALVDIGWNGTIQYYLNNLISKDTILNGYYYGINKDKKYSKYTNIKRIGYSFSNDVFSENQIYTYLGIGLFELMFLSDEPSTIGYKQINQKVECIKSEELYSEETKKCIKHIQNGAKAFIDNIHENNISRDITINSEAWNENFKNIIIHPTLKNIKIFKNFEVQNFDTKKLIDNKNILYYLFKPKHLYIDLMNSYCKTLFLKNIFKIKLPYYKILKKFYINRKGTNDE